MMFVLVHFSSSRPPHSRNLNSMCSTSNRGSRFGFIYRRCSPHAAGLAPPPAHHTSVIAALHKCPILYPGYVFGNVSILF